MKPAVKIAIAVLLILDLLLFAIVIGTLRAEETEPAALEATEVVAPVVTTLATESTVIPETTAETQPTETVPTIPPDEEFILSFAGDCTFGASPGIYYAQLAFVKTVGDDLGYPFRNVIQYFEDDDFTMVNLEGVLADRGNPVPKAHNFRGPVKFAGILTQGGVEAVTLANNHTMDYGPKGYESTLEALQNENVPYVEPNGTCMVTTDRGLKIGIYGMTYADMNLEDMLAGIAKLQEQGAELIIVAAHWGVELQYEPDEEQIQLGRAAIDAGAHIVYGSHPHVLQPVEEYGGGIIYYSLGNFSFGGNGNPKDYDTVILRQQVIRKVDGTIELGTLTPVPASVSSVSGKNNFQPTPYEEGSEQYQRVLSKLQGTYE